MSDMYDVARQVTDEVLGEGAYAASNRGNPDPGVQAAIARPTFDEIYGPLIKLGLIEQTGPGKWRPSVRGVRAAQMVITTILACPNDGTPEEIEALTFSAAILSGLARAMEE